MAARENDPGGVSRRDFIVRAGAAASGVALGGGIAVAATRVLARDESRLPPIEAVDFSPEDPLRIALIGLGARTTFGLLPHVLRRDDVRIVACCDPEPGNLNRALDRIEKATGFRPQGYAGPTDYEVALRRDDVRAVVSACPCDLHAAIHLEAMERGKHLYGEKPACLTVAEARMLEEAWRRCSTVAQIGFQRRASPRYREGIAAIRAGEIGEPIEARAAWSGSGESGGVGGWLDRRARSGDRMIERACSAWDALNWALDATPLRASGAGRRDPRGRADRDATDFFAATLEYPGGVLATYTHSSHAPHRDNGAFSGVFERVAGSAGGIDLGAGRISYVDPKREPRSVSPDSPDATRASMDAFFDSVKRGRRPDSGIDNGVAATLTGLLVRRAVDERRFVEMEEIRSGQVL